MHMEFQTMGNPFKLVVSAHQRITKLEPLTNWLRSPVDRLGRWRCCHRSWYGATGGSGWTGTTGRWRHTHANLMASWYGVKSLNLWSWRLDVLWREGAQSMERPKTKTRGTETSFQSKLIKIMMLQWKFVLTFRIFHLTWYLFYVYHDIIFILVYIYNLFGMCLNICTLHWWLLVQIDHIKLQCLRSVGGRICR